MEAKEVIKNLEGTDVWNDASNAGLDPSEIVSNISDKLSKYGEKRAISIASSAINREVKNIDKEFVTVKGIVVGGSDKFGTRAPISYACLDNKGNPFKIATWDHNLITYPNIVEIKGEKDSKYNNILVDEVISTDPVQNNIPEKLSTIARDTFSNFDDVNQYDIVIVKGVVRWVNPAAKFEDGKKIGSYEIMETREYPNADLHPVLVMSLDPMTSQNRINLLLPRQRAGRPSINIEDFYEIVKDGYEQSRGDPNKQAMYVGDAIKGIEIIVVGEVGSIKEVWNADTSRMDNFINISAYYVEEIGFDGESIKKPVNPSKEDKPKKETEKEKKTKKETKKKEDIPKDTESSSTNEYGEVIRDIVTLSKILKRAPSEISLDEIRKSLEIKLNDSLVKVAVAKAEEEYNKIMGRSK